MNRKFTAEEAQAELARVDALLRASPTTIYDCTHITAVEHVAPVTFYENEIAVLRDILRAWNLMANGRVVPTATRALRSHLFECLVECHNMREDGAHEMVWKLLGRPE